MCWTEVREWVRTSYTLVAPKKLANQVLTADGLIQPNIAAKSAIPT